jgi:shikimate kinase
VEGKTEDYKGRPSWKTKTGPSSSKNRVCSDPVISSNAPCHPIALNAPKPLPSLFIQGIEIKEAPVSIFLQNDRDCAKQSLARNGPFPQCTVFAARFRLRLSYAGQDGGTSCVNPPETGKAEIHRRKRMRISLIGMAGAGKTYWAIKLAQQGFRRFCCDDLIAAKLAPDLTRPDGSTMGMGEWMGFPYGRDYKRRESQYLNCEIEVLNEILEYLESTKNATGENIVVDTTGSLVYAGEDILRKLRRYTTMVYLAIPPEVRERLLKAYIFRPHPMLWRDAFNKAPGETNEESLARCYPRLLSSREQLYDRYADVKIEYYRRHEESFGVRDFLNAIETNG